MPRSAARAAVAAAVGQGGYGRRELVLRVNGLDSEWGEGDLAAAAGMAIDAVLLPKVESAERVRDTVARLDRAGARGPRGVVHDRDAARGARRRRDRRFQPAGRGAGDGHVGPHQGFAGARDAGSRAAADLARAGAAGGAGAWARGARRGASRFGRRCGASPPSAPQGRDARLRRQDADPSKADRPGQRRLRRRARPRWRRRRRSSPRTRRRSRPARALWSSTAA